MKKLTESNAARSVAVLIFITFVLRCLIAAYTGLGIGESYYFRGTLHFNLSYFDQPPLFFWLGRLSVQLFGLNNFGIRFPSVLLFAGTTWLLFLITKKLFNAKAGFWAATIMNLSAVFTVSVACWFQPDAPLMFFWLAATYFIVEIMVIPGDNSAGSRNSRRTYLLWIAVGICMGLATLSKYHVAFLFAGVFMFVGTNNNQRHWLRHPGPYLAVLITIIIAFPVIWWNYNNGWVSFIFQGSRAGVNTEKFSLHFDWFFRSILGQSLVVLPWIWFPAIRQLFISYKLRHQLLAYSFSFWLSVLPIVFFTVVTLWSNLQYHFHWQAPGYMMLFMPLGFAIDKGLHGDATKRLTRRWLNFSVCFTIITIGVISLHMVTGFWKSYGPKWVVHFHGDTVDPTIQGVDYIDILTRFEKEGWINNPKIFAGSTRWWMMGKVDWALKGRKDIVVFNADPRNLAFLVNPKTLIGKDAIIIGDNPQLDINKDVVPFFDNVKQLPDIAIMRNGVDEYHVQVYYCKNFHLPAKMRMDLPLYRQLLGLPPFGK